MRPAFVERLRSSLSHESTEWGGIMSAPLKPYSNYRPSGAEWFDFVPTHWDVRRLRNVAELRVSTVDKHTREHEEHVRLCNYVDVYKNDRISTTMNFMVASAAPDEIERYRLERDDVLITKDSETWDDIGVPALVSDPGQDLISGYHLALLRPRSEHAIGGYLFRALQCNAIACQFHVQAKGVTRFGLTNVGIRSVKLPVPSLPEQTAIVRFLDRIDRRIRRYIRTKQQVVSLLAEKKQAIIEQAFTGQIDVRTGQPYASYKPSGVKWIGDIPGHWDVQRLRNAIHMRVSTVDKNTNEGERPVRLCNYVDVYKNDYIKERMDFMHATATDEEIERFRLEIDDVLITKDSEAWDDIGVPALVVERVYNLIAGYHLALLRPRKDRLLGVYLLRSLQSYGLAYQFHIAANGVTRYGLSQASIKSIRIPLPSLAEQEAIACFLARTVADVASAVAKTQRQIDLIRDYRTRLIADVVTGKLDVRKSSALSHLISSKPRRPR